MFATSIFQTSFMQTLQNPVNTIYAPMLQYTFEYFWFFSHCCHCHIETDVKAKYASTILYKISRFQLYKVGYRSNEFLEYVVFSSPHSHCLGLNLIFYCEPYFLKSWILFHQKVKENNIKPIQEHCQNNRSNNWLIEIQNLVLL